MKMEVRPYDRLRFAVTSESHPEVEYLVDLSEDPFTCQCSDFVGRAKAKKGLECKHLAQVRKFLVEQIVYALREQEKE